MLRALILAAIAAAATVLIIAYSAGWLGRSVTDEACSSRAFEGSNFTVCAFDARRHSIELAWADGYGTPYRSFEAYERDNGSVRVRFAMIAGIFDEYGAPLGLLRSNGVTVRQLNTGSGKGNFYLKPNGVFFGNDSFVSVASTEGFSTSDSTRFATQSGPMLVIHGRLHPSFDEDGSSVYTRNGVGVRDAQTAFFVISEDIVSFGKFARFFRDVLGCNDALYLDGNISSLWVPSEGRRDADHVLGPMIIVRVRALKQL